MTRYVLYEKKGRINYQLILNEREAKVLDVLIEKDLIPLMIHSPDDINQSFRFKENSDKKLKPEGFGVEKWTDMNISVKYNDGENDYWGDIYRVEE